MEDGEPADNAARWSSAEQSLLKSALTKSRRFVQATWNGPAEKLSSCRGVASRQCLLYLPTTPDYLYQSASCPGWPLLSIPCTWTSAASASGC